MISCAASSFLCLSTSTNLHTGKEVTLTQFCITSFKATKICMSFCQRPTDHSKAFWLQETQSLINFQLQLWQMTSVRHLTSLCLIEPCLLLFGICLRWDYRKGFPVSANMFLYNATKSQVHNDWRGWHCAADECWLFDKWVQTGRVKQQILQRMGQTFHCFKHRFHFSCLYVISLPLSAAQWRTNNRTSMSGPRANCTA